MAAGGGCGKRNDLGGWLNDSAFEDWRVVKGHAAERSGPNATICFNFSSIQLNPYGSISLVYGSWL